MSSHRQPRSPAGPSSCSSAADKGDPKELDSGMATMNMATMRAR